MVLVKILYSHSTLVLLAGMVFELLMVFANCAKYCPNVAGCAADRLLKDRRKTFNMKINIRITELALAFVVLTFLGAAPVGQRLLAQDSYQLPNSDSGCPTNCLQIQWQAGSDLWNSGVLPVYSQVTCLGLAENGTTDDTNNIQNCINAAAAGSNGSYGNYSTCHAAGGCAVYLPAGNIYVAGMVRLQSNVVVRGAKAEGNVYGTTWLPGTDSGATTIILGSNGQLTTQNFSSGGGSIYPATSYGALQSTCSLSGTPNKGDTTLTINSSGSCAVSAGTWIQVFGNDNPSLINNNGTDGWCEWCGDNTGYYVMMQTVQVTAITSGTGGSGSNVTISKPLYYPPYTSSVSVNGSTEPAGAKYAIITFPTQKAGYENFRVDGSQNDVGADSMVLFQGCLYCWANGLDVYVTGSSSGSAHIELDYTYGNEVRNSYLHDQRSGASGAGYGVYFQFQSGDGKVENNVIRHTRHWIVFQGGTSGTAVLYNYADDGYTDDTTYLASGRTSHGAHDYFNLFEGNVASHVTADDFWGTTSHTVFWRNWLWGDETMNWNLNGCTVCQSTNMDGTTSNGFDAVDLYQSQQYYSYVGNVLGTSAIPTGANNSCAVASTESPHATWSNATTSISCTTNNCGYEAPGAPGVYSYGSSGLGSAAQSNSTITRNGNYDYKAAGVAYWDGGSTNNTLANSLYYSSKPSFFGTCRWPVVGYDQSPVYALNPAEATYLGANIGAAPPSAPSNLQATPH